MATKSTKSTGKTQFLSDEWFGQVGVLAAGSPSGSLSARIQGVVSGGPDGDVKCRIVFDGGTLAAIEAGVADAADLTLTVVYDDAVAIQKGELVASVAFMQGRMKTAGDPGLVLQVLAASASPEFDGLRDQVNAVTQY